MYSEIQLPTGQNDYICRVMLDGEPRVLHLSYNSTGDYWTVGFCDSEGNPIVDGIRIVPNFPLNMWYLSYNIPQGVLFAKATDDITRYSFDNGDAVLCYLPVEDLET